MTDIVERLRTPSVWKYDPRLKEAADEIERLRAQNAELKEARRNLEERLNAEIRDLAHKI